MSGLFGGGKSPPVNYVILSQLQRKKKPSYRPALFAPEGGD